MIPVHSCRRSIFQANGRNRKPHDRYRGRFKFEPPSRFTSFDHLVGQGEQLVGNLKAKRLCYAEIDDQLELGWLHYREVGRFLTFEDTAGVHADLAIGVGQVRSVGDESPGYSKLAAIVDGGKAMACRQCDYLIAPPEEVGIGADDERAGSLVNKRGKSGSHVMLPAGVHDNESLVD